MSKMRVGRIEFGDRRITPGSGNVFADLGFPDPDDELLKAELTRRVRLSIEERRLRPAAAAKLLGIDRQTASQLLKGHLGNISSGRLMAWLAALGHDVNITITRTGKQGRGQIRVVSAAFGGTRLPMRNSASRPDDENPEWTAEDFRTARPLLEVLPKETVAALRRYQSQRGYQPKPTKRHRRRKPA